MPAEASFADVRRREFPGAGDGVYLNAASFGLLPRRSMEAVRELTEARGGPGRFDEAELGEALERARSTAARLIGARAEDVVLAPNTSYGVNLAAALARRREPGTIVVSDGEFPANVFPWMPLRREGFQVERVPADELGRPDEGRLLERIAAADVRAFALSSVQFSTGYAADVEAFGRTCREHDVLFAVDAIQSLGVVPLDVEACGIDVLASGAQKWLCSPWGSGLAWIAPRHRDDFDPPLVSWLGMEGATDFQRLLEYRYEFAGDGRKYELATLGIQDYVGMSRSIELILEVGVERIRSHVADLAEPLFRWLEETEGAVGITPREPWRRAGIVSFRIPGQERAVAALREAGVELAVRGGAVRLAPHLYNTREELEGVVEILDGAVAGAPPR